MSERGREKEGASGRERERESGANRCRARSDEEGKREGERERESAREREAACTGSEVGQREGDRRYPHHRGENYPESAWGVRPRRRGEPSASEVSAVPDTPGPARHD